jgi:hypothetical protein
MGIALFFCCCVAPGLALAMVLVDRSTPLVVLTLGATLGLFLLPSLYFGLAILFGTNITPQLLLVTSVAVCALCATRWVHLRRTGEKPGSAHLTDG